MDMFSLPNRFRSQAYYPTIFDYGISLLDISQGKFMSEGNILQ